MAYDFTDWEIGSFDFDALQKFVVENLKTAHEAFLDGSWSACSPRLEWLCRLEQDEASSITLTPDQFRDAVIEWFRDQYPSDCGDWPGPPSEEQREGLREEWQAISGEWRNALDAIDDEAKRLLDLPIRSR